MFATQTSRNKTSSGDIGLNIRTLASPEVGQDQVSGGVRNVVEISNNQEMSLQYTYISEGKHWGNSLRLASEHK